MTTRKLATFLLLAAFALLGIFLVSSCRTVPKNRPVPVIVVPPVNPDIAPVRIPVSKAQSSVQRATVIVEKLVPAPGQEEQIKALRLELSTTAAELTDALAKIPVLQEQTEELVAKWFAENARATALYEQYQVEQTRADTAVKRERQRTAERNFFINLFAIGLTAGIIIVALPFIRQFSALAGAWQPAAALVLFLVVSGAAYGFSFWAVLMIMKLLIVIL
jgi:hypothetical protein